MVYFTIGFIVLKTEEPNHGTLAYFIIRYRLKIGVIEIELN
jgi:hypothetical protein